MLPRSPGLPCTCLCACLCGLPVGAWAVDGELEVIVHAPDGDEEDTRAGTTLTEEDLRDSMGEDLASTLEAAPGVRAAKGLATVSKPVIRGLGERRLLLLNDGIRHESQKWGPNHAPELDPFSAGEIRVLRGAAGVRYGPDAIGGVVLVRPPPLRDEAGVGGVAQLAYTTNGRRPYGALRLDIVPAAQPDWTVRIEGNLGIGGTLSTPTYLLGNTASRVWNLGTTIERRFTGGSLSVGWHHHDLTAGIFHGVMNSTPDDFEAQLAADRPVTADLWTRTYTIERAMQDVTHDIARADLELHGEAGVFELSYAYQHNQRDEFEQVRPTITGSQYAFTLRTHSLDGVFRHTPVELPFARLRGEWGIQGSFQENVYRGYPLIPNHRSFGGGVFAIERLQFSRVDVEAGVRADGLIRNAYLTETDLRQHQERGTATHCDASGRCPTALSSPSVALGFLGHVVPDVLDVKLDLSSASRFPSVDEQFLSGSAPSFPVWALGSPDLRQETAWGASVSAIVDTPFVAADVSFFARRFDDFILFSPARTASGEPRYAATILGTWPVYEHLALDARSSGTDGVLRLGPTSTLGLDVLWSAVRITDKDGTHLPGTPGDQIRATAHARIAPIGPLRRTTLSAHVEHTGRQSRVDPALEFAPPPDGVTLLGLSANTTVSDRFHLGLDVHNLLNTRYRTYPSLLRFYADQPGRDVRVRVAVDL